MNILRMFRRPLHLDAQPGSGAVTLARILTGKTLKRARLESRWAANNTAISMLICASSLAGCASDGGSGARAVQSSSDGAGASSGMQPDGRAANAGYVVGPTDVLEISVFKVPELSKAVQVADTGAVNLPLLGEVKVAGKTASEIEQDLSRQLGTKYLKSPQVTVLVKDHNSQQVTIEGAVRRPGVYPIKGTLTLIQLIASAEGVDRDYYYKDVTVFSTFDGTRTSSVYDIDAIREGKAQDIPLHKGDLVVVDTSMAKSAFQNALKVVPVAATLRP